MITLAIVAVVIGINGTLAIHWELVWNLYSIRLTKRNLKYKGKVDPRVWDTIRSDIWCTWYFCRSKLNAY